jgi:hypothetical protein
MFCLAKKLFHVADGAGVKVKNARDEHGGGLAFQILPKAFPWA